METILKILEAGSYELWLTGKNNFRYNVYPEYKANRIGAYRPKWEKDVKEYLVREWGATYTDGCEADDMLGAHQTEDTIIVSQDKDLKQIKGWHYNFVKDHKFFVTPEEADRFFYYQCLVGDPTDFIKGVQGIGPVKANKLLDGTPCGEWWETVQAQFSCEEEFDLNAQCVYIWRKEQDHYTSIKQSQRETPTTMG